MIESEKQARSSVWLERFLDTEEVDGSSPFGPTIFVNNLDQSIAREAGICDLSCVVIALWFSQQGPPLRSASLPYLRDSTANTRPNPVAVSNHDPYSDR